MPSDGCCGRRLGLLVDKLPGFSMNGFQLFYRLKIVDGSWFSIIEWQESLVGAALQPISDFSFSNSCEGDSVFFTNISSGAITNWLWDFNDGSIDTIQNQENIKKLLHF